MEVLKARVRNGRLVLDEPTTLPEGQEVELVTLQAAEAMHDDEMTDEERAELHRALGESVAQYERGEFVDASVVLAELKAANEAHLQQASARRGREGK